MADHESFSVGQPAGAWRGRWSWRRRIVVALAAFALVLGSTGWVLHRAAQIRRQTEIDLIRAAGEPLTFEDLKALREPIPDEQNGALMLVRLFEAMDEEQREHLSTINGSYWQWTELGERWNAETWEAMEAALALQEETLAGLHAAVALEQGAFPNEWSLDTSLVHGSEVRHAVKLLAMEAMARVQRGDIAGSMASCQAMLRVAGWLEADPFLISLLVRIACESSAIGTLEWMLAASEPDEASLQTFQARLEQLHDDHESLRRALFGERVISLAIYSSARAGTTSPLISSPAYQWVSAMFLLPGFVDVNEQKYLQFVREWCEAAKLPLNKAWPRMKELDGRMASLSFYHAVAGIALPSLARAMTIYVQSRVHACAAAAAIEVELYRRTHGRWPATLEEVFADAPTPLPRDPFNGNAPMRYIVDETGCTIYSLGENEIDDGGSTSGRADIAFRLLSPHLRGATVTTQPVDKTVWEAIEALRAATTQPAAATVPVR